MAKDYYQQALFLIHNQYVPANTNIDMLMKKLQDNDLKATVTNTTESVYGTENVKMIKHLADHADPQKSVLVEPGEKTKSKWSGKDD